MVGEAVESLLNGYPPPPTQILEEDTGVVPRSGGSRPSARSGHTRTDHGGARGAVLRRTPPPPRGEMIPISVPPSPINNSVPTEEEVEWEVRRLWGHRSGGPSQVRSENLREWLREHRAEKSAEAKAKEEKAEAEGETSGSEERESEAKEGTADVREERDTTKWDKVVELVQLVL